MLLGKNSPFKTYSSDRSDFVNEPLSNFDFLNYLKHLGVRYFRGIFSRDNLPNKISKEYGIVNLDSKIGPGTHWVCYRNIYNYCEYFDRFGLNMPKDIQRYMSTSGNKLNK